MQQKYCDQGRSVIVLRITRLMPRARISCGLGREAEKGVALSGDEPAQGIALRAGDPLDVLLGVEPNVLRHDREVEMAARAQGVDAHAPTLQVADAADRLTREQLVAADVQSADRGHRSAQIQMMNDSSGKGDVEVQLTICQHLTGRDAQARVHIPDIREAFAAQERLHHVRRREANGGRLLQANRGCLQRALARERAARAKDASGRGQRRTGQEIAAGLHDMHAKSPV
jgi:hypothetical protein